MKKINSSMVDADPSLKDIPMFSSDEVEIKLNSILYRISWTSGYSFEKEGEYKVEALRVFFVNNSARIFRVKCMRGCEEVFKVADGCSSPVLYGKLSSATRDLKEKMRHDLEKCERKQKAIADTWTHIDSAMNAVTKLKEKDIRLPKEVRT